jgi:hypothetical protein
MHLFKNFLILNADGHLANGYLMALIASLAKGCSEASWMVFMAFFAKELQMAYLIVLIAKSFRAAYLMMLIAFLAWTFKGAY